MVKKHKNIENKGQSSIEFVLVIPVLVLIVLIVSQLGYLVYLQNTLEQAAREATRAVSTTNSNNAAYKQVFQVCQSLDRERLNIEITPSGPGERTVGDPVRVTVSLHYGGMANFLDIITGDSFLVKSSSMMRMEAD